MRVVFLSSLACLGIGAFLILPLGDSNSAPRGSEMVGTQPQNPKELGWVNWKRDYEKGALVAKAQGKPIFLLFQEVPGCATCVGFGESVLAHPLLIEAIETEFVPIAIHNNKGGSDKVTLKRFGEPAWNNPVVRFVNAKGKDLLPRKDGVWSTKAIAKRMVAALQAAKRPVPGYLQTLVDQFDQFAGSDKKATFAMHCYWSGEACLGEIAGVTGTRAGWLGGREVVEVQYNSAKVSKKRLQAIADKKGCGEFVAKAGRARPAKSSDQKYHLQHSRWRFVPLTPSQAGRVNAALGRGSRVERWVSPRQNALFKRIQAAPAASLNGLTRPTNVRDLAAYEWKLRAALDSAKKS